MPIDGRDMLSRMSNIPDQENVQRRKAAGYGRTLGIPESGRIRLWIAALALGRVARKTAERYEAGQEEPIDWAAAKRELRKRAE